MRCRITACGSTASSRARAGASFLPTPRPRDDDAAQPHPHACHCERGGAGGVLRHEPAAGIAGWCGRCQGVGPAAAVRGGRLARAENAPDRHSDECGAAAVRRVTTPGPLPLCREHPHDVASRCGLVEACWAGPRGCRAQDAQDGAGSGRSRERRPCCRSSRCCSRPGTR